METYGQILNIAMPVFLVFVLVEKAYGWWQERHPFRIMDTIASLSSGLTNVLKDVLGLSVSVISYEWMVEHLAITSVSASLWMYIIAFLTLDFSGYWVHRISHSINFFWNRHLVHHSSEEFDLACALRQSISVFVHLFTFLLLPAALLGVPVTVIAVIAPLHLFAQFWYHTIYIGKMGWLEHIIVTPSHHRVHHAINPLYIDKNYGNIFIFWDKWFGTFQEELPEHPPVYGITKPVRTWNPIRINFQHLLLLIRDAWYTHSWRDKLRIWWMPTGWRPADAAARFPVSYIEDIYHFEKYDTGSSPARTAWTAAQFTFTFLLMSWLFAHIADIGSPDIFIYGGFLFLSIYAFAENMDHRPSAWRWEGVKSLLGLGLLYQQQGNWFQLDNFIPGLSLFVGLWLLISPAVTAYFCYAPAEQPDLQSIKAKAA